MSSVLISADDFDLYSAQTKEIERLSAESAKWKYILNLVVGGPMPLTPESLRGLADYLESANG